MKEDRDRLYEEKSVLSGPAPDGKAAMRTGSMTPMGKFDTFPLADAEEIQEISGERLPDAEDVWFVKEFGDENEK